MLRTSLLIAPLLAAGSAFGQQPAPTDQPAPAFNRSLTPRAAKDQTTTTLGIVAFFGPTLVSQLDPNSISK